MTSYRDWPVWMAPTIGIIPPDKLFARVEESCWMGNDVREILKQQTFTLLQNSMQIPLTKIQLHELGLTEKPRSDELFDPDWLSSFSLDVCPAETALHILYVFPDRPRRRGSIEKTYIAMKPISSPWSGTKVVFDFGWTNDGKRYLGTRQARPGDRWPLEYEFVFSLRQ